LAVTSILRGETCAAVERSSKIAVNRIAADMVSSISLFFISSLVSDRSS